MERSTMVLGTSDAADPQPTAVLRLRRGASEWGSWKFQTSDVGAILTVGADRCCDWRIAAAGVAPIELYVRFTGRALQVKSARPYCGGRLDGALLGQEWLSIEQSGRLDMGTACIEATVMEPGAEALHDPSQPPQGRDETTSLVPSLVPPQPASLLPPQPASWLPPQQLRGVPDDARYPRRPVVIPPPPPEPLARVPVTEIAVRTSVEPPSPAPRSHGGRRSTFVPPPSVDNPAPQNPELAACVLGQESQDHAITDLVRYALIALIALAAYGLWLLILDSF